MRGYFKLKFSFLIKSKFTSIETTGNINLVQYAKSQEVLTGTAIATAYVVINYLTPDGKEKTLTVPVEEER